MPDGPTTLLILKVLVSTVTVLFVLSLVALALGNRRLHGRINTLFFVLTITTVLGFELLLRLGHDVTSQFSEEARRWLRIHLMFSIPATLLLPVQFVLGIRGYKRGHVPLGIVFAILWTGTFITGVVFLPHR